MPHRLVISPHVVGAKQTLKALQADQVEMVYLARDADLHVTAPIRKQCETIGVNIVEVVSMAELGKACGIEVGAAVASVMKTTPNKN